MKKLIAVLCVISLLMLTSCNVINNDPQQLMRPPKAIGELKGIEDALYKSVGNNISLLYPKSEDKRSAYLQYDIDNDGVEDVLAFYSIDANVADNTKSLSPHINVIKKVNGVWKSVLDTVVDVSGIDTIQFVDLTGDGKVEIIAGCSLYSVTDKKLIVYSYQNEKLNIRMSESYSIYTVTDLNNDKTPEIFYTTIDSLKKTSTAKLVSISGDGLTIVGSTSMDGNITDYASITVKNVNETIKGVYIDAYKGQNAMITELVFMKNGKLYNPFIDSAFKINQSTMRESAVLSTDINKDGYNDIPQLIELPVKGGDTQDKYYLTVWRRFDGEYFKNSLTCLMNNNDGYYFVFTDQWVGNVTVERMINERKRVFKRWDFTSQKAGSEIFTLQVFSEEAWGKSHLPDFVEIARQNKLVYTVKLGETEDSFTISLEDIKARFHLIESN